MPVKRLPSKPRVGLAQGARDVGGGHADAQYLLGMRGARQREDSEGGEGGGRGGGLQASCERGRDGVHWRSSCVGRRSPSFKQAACQSAEAHGEGGQPRRCPALVCFLQVAERVSTNRYMTMDQQYLPASTPDACGNR